MTVLADRSGQTLVLGTPFLEAVTGLPANRDAQATAEGAAAPTARTVKSTARNAENEGRPSATGPHDQPIFETRVVSAVP